MNRNTKLKPLAPRPVADQSCHQIMSYPCHPMAADGRAGSFNRNAFVGANLGVHASPLEAVTSMDPKDYVWGGGYNASFYGCQSSAFAGAQPCYYPQASEYPGHNSHYGEPSRQCFPDGMSAGQIMLCNRTDVLTNAAFPCCLCCLDCDQLWCAGYAHQYQPVTGMTAASQPYACSASPLPYPGSAADSSRGDLSGQAGSLCDTQTSENKV